MRNAHVFDILLTMLRRGRGRDTQRKRQRIFNMPLDLCNRQRIICRDAVYRVLRGLTHFPLFLMLLNANFCTVAPRTLTSRLDLAFTLSAFFAFLAPLTF